MQESEKRELGKVYLDHGLVFCNQDGRLLHPNSFTKRFQSLLRKAGIKQISFHGLRHSVATALIKKNTHLKEIQELLGHSSIVTTGDTYSHVLDEMKRDTTSALIDLLPGNTKEPLN